MAEIKVVINGALGRMGTLIIQEAAKLEGLELVAGADVVGGASGAAAGCAGWCRRGQQTGRKAERKERL